MLKLFVEFFMSYWWAYYLVAAPLFLIVSGRMLASKITVRRFFGLSTAGILLLGVNIGVAGHGAGWAFPLWVLFFAPDFLFASFNKPYLMGMTLACVAFAWVVSMVLLGFVIGVISMFRKLRAPKTR